MAHVIFQHFDGKYCQKYMIALNSYACNCYHCWFILEHYNCLSGKVIDSKNIAQLVDCKLQYESYNKELLVDLHRNDFVDIHSVITGTV